MQKIFTLSFFLIILLFVGPGCTTKKMIKQAGQLEMAGMFKHAAEIYYRGAIRKPNKMEFKTGLRRAGFMYVEDVSQEMNRSYNRGDYQKVVYDYLTIEEFTNRVRRTGVEISIDHNTRRLYDNAQNQYLNDRYEAGMKFLGESRFGEARGVFQEIFNINPDFKDTRVHLNTATLEPIYQAGTRMFGQKNYMGAYTQWAKVMSVDAGYKDTRRRMNDALNERYKEGNLFLINEDFISAARALGDVYNVNPSFQDVRKLFVEAQCEPLYRQSITSMHANRCREAYLALLRIQQIAGGDYKDSGRIRPQALQCASYPIAIHAKAMPNHSADGSEFENALLQSILKKEDPFIKIHSLPSLNSRIHRSFLGAATLNRAMLRELHDRQGIKAILVINYTQYDRVQKNPERVQRKGIIRQTITEKGETTYRDTEVNYFEYSGNNSVSLALNYQLISTLTGEILLSQRLSASEQSQMHYALYEGADAKNLYPTNRRNGNDMIDERNFSNLQQLLSADKTLAPVNKLRETVFLDLTDKISNDLVRFNPER